MILITNLIISTNKLRWLQKPSVLKIFLGFVIIEVINISCNPNLTEIFVQKYFNINLPT